MQMLRRELHFLIINIMLHAFKLLADADILHLVPWELDEGIFISYPGDFKTERQSAEYGLQHRKGTYYNAVPAALPCSDNSS